MNDTRSVYLSDGQDSVWEDDLGIFYLEHMDEPTASQAPGGTADVSTSF